MPIQTEREALAHVLRNDCRDPDCEVHHPEVGLEEGTVSPICLAFFMAGAYAMRELIMVQSENAWDAALAELKDDMALNGDPEIVARSV